MRHAPSYTLIIGPMFSGKTTTLMSEVERCARARMRCVVFNHADDSRYGDNAVTSHNGVSMGAIMTHRLMPHAESRMADIADAQVIAIDECQFFDDLVPFVRWCLEQGKILIAAGLNGDIHMHRMGHVADTMCYATNVIFKTAVCVDCGADAAYSVLAGSAAPDAPAAPIADSAAAADPATDPDEFRHIGVSDYVACCWRCRAVHMAPKPT